MAEEVLSNRASGAASPLVYRIFERIRQGWRAFVWYVKGVIGESDYETYCAHMRRHHADEPLPTVSEYWRQRYADEDAHPTSRCC